ncbi:hypothetical protein F5Y04DRAFT_27082 [Hypomontagnella monticulosa]|nr:hypothetical protein F5Y04DRAFT_27082 [Hypomontagnella monticulosa]
MRRVFLSLFFFSCVLRINGSRSCALQVRFGERRVCNTENPILISGDPYPIIERDSSRADRVFAESQILCLSFRTHSRIS